jgi:6-phosphogluconolactonase
MADPATATATVAVAVAASPALLVFVSMFAAAPDGGIQAFRLDPLSGALTPLAARQELPHSFFLTPSCDRRHVYALSAGTFGDAATEEVTAWRIVGRDGGLELVGRTPAGGAATCFVATAAGGRTLLLAHYDGGTVATLNIAADGRLAGPPEPVPHACNGSAAVPERQGAPHPHSLVPAPTAAGRPRFAYAADLGCDAIFCYPLDPVSGRLSAADPPLVKTPAGAGPRHLTFSPAGRRLYAINELANTVGVYDFDDDSGRLTERQMISTLPEGFAGTSKTADVRVTPDGRFLYGTNRGHDSLAAYAIAADGRLRLIDIVPSRGRGPQNIAISPDGGLLVCGNMPGDSVAVFRIDRATGRLTPLGDPLRVTSPSSIAIVGPAAAGGQAD